MDIGDLATTSSEGAGTAFSRRRSRVASIASAFWERHATHERRFRSR